MSISSPAVPAQYRATLRNWRVIAGALGFAGGAAIVAGAFLPWVETFAGLIGIPGVQGSYGRILAVAGVVIATAGLWHAVRGGQWSRWMTGIGGFAALGFAGYLLIELAATTKSLGGSSMVLAQGGPGLWVIAGGSLVAFGTLFLPASTVVRPAGQPLGLTRWAEGIRLARWTGDLESRGLRRRIQIGLGLVWLLDAALQFQPYMFGRAFVTQQLIPAAAGNPAVVANPALWTNRLVLHDVAAWNTAFALIQLAIAMGLLWRPTVKAALAGSVWWAVSVWWFGEGLGGLLTGTASPVTGAPGAVILYALIALLVWPRRAGADSRDVAATGLLGARWSRVPWVVLWGGFSYLVLQPAVRAPGALRDAIAGNAAGQPWWLATLDRDAATAVGPRRVGLLDRAGRGVRADRGRGAVAGDGPSRGAAGHRGRPGDLGDRGELRDDLDGQRHRPGHRAAAGAAGRRVLATGEVLVGCGQGRPASDGSSDRGGRQRGQPA